MFFQLALGIVEIVHLHTVFNRRCNPADWKQQHPWQNPGTSCQDTIADAGRHTAKYNCQYNHIQNSKHCNLPFHSCCHNQRLDVGNSLFHHPAIQKQQNAENHENDRRQMKKAQNQTDQT